MKQLSILMILALLVSACGENHVTDIDILLRNGTIYNGENEDPIIGDLAIAGDSIVWLGPPGERTFLAKEEIDVQGMIVCPGFIDPHTHAMDDLLDSTKHKNLPFLMQGVSTVLVGNDGGGKLDIAATIRTYEELGIGTNAALLVGHGTIRRAVMGLSDEEPDSSQLAEMKEWVRRGMEAGAMGLSTGLYYSPGSYARTEEVIELAKIAAEYGGYYDTHMRDESTYNIGLQNAVREAIRIGKEGGLPSHIAHIKALGVDVWDQSKDVIAIVDSARKAGLEVTADQYPYRASGTSLSACLIPRWVMTDSRKAMKQRMTDPALLPRIRKEMAENLRKRGGAASLLITRSKDTSLLGKTLEDIAAERKTSAIEAAIEILLNGQPGVASFNMKDEDLINFMQQDWVMTGSDGSYGHPRKYGSFPRKYVEYVKKNQVLTLESFIHKSTLLPATSLGIRDRGHLIPGAKADVIVFDPEAFQPEADFSHPRELATGLVYAFINGKTSVKEGSPTGQLVGQVIKNQSPSHPQ